MSTIQNIKNFIRHGKQARLVPPHSEPTTDISTVHAQQQPQPQGQFSPALDSFDAELRGNGHAAWQKQNESQVRHDRSVEIERLVAEENVSRSKMPKYAGLERWVLVEKMGDGAFSNVYRAKDTTTEYGEVAIKVVRKFEMNSNQVGRPVDQSAFSFLCDSAFLLSRHGPIAMSLWNQRQYFCSPTLFIKALKGLLGLRRCAILS